MAPLVVIRAPYIRRTGWTVIAVLTTVVMVFVGIRVSQDLPAVISGDLPPVDSFERRYAEYPMLAYAHIVPGVVYLLVAPLQVSRSFRRRSLRRHRKLGRVALVAGMLTGFFAIVVGTVFPFGGLAETSASVVFGIYFLTALALAYRAIRAGREADHRSWMIRAFAIGVGVGSIRMVIGAAQVLGVSFEAIFGPAFWIAFLGHALAAELWLRRFPDPR